MDYPSTDNPSTDEKNPAEDIPGEADPDKGNEQIDPIDAPFEGPIDSPLEAPTEDNKDSENVNTEEKSGSGFGGKAFVIGGIGLVATIFYCRRSTSSKAKRQYNVPDDNLELDDLEKGIYDIEREIDYDDDAGSPSYNKKNSDQELDPDEEAFFEEMSDNDEGYENYGDGGFTKF